VLRPAVARGGLRLGAGLREARFGQARCAAAACSAARGAPASVRLRQLRGGALPGGGQRL
jgi:hypothetical protein